MVELTDHGIIIPANADISVLTIYLDINESW